MIPSALEEGELELIPFGRQILAQGVPENGVIYLEAESLDILLLTISAEEYQAHITSYFPIENLPPGITISQPEELYGLIREVIDLIWSVYSQNIQAMLDQFKWILLEKGIELVNFPEEISLRLFGGWILTDYWLRELQLLPLDHLLGIRSIHLHDREDGTARAVTNQIESSREALVHEIEHIVGFRVLGILATNPAFQDDPEFREEFYPEVRGVIPRAIPSANKHETFATMADMYMTEPHTLRDWIVKRLKEGSTLSALNYLFLKENVFHNLEYGDTTQIRFWKGEADGVEGIFYISPDECGFVPF